MSFLDALIRNYGPGGFSGSTCGDWMKVLQRNRFAVDLRYVPRALGISAISVVNTILRHWENLRYGDRIEQTAVPPPLFVLGIWRSGTTHLHNMLSKDERFAFPNAYQVYNPHTFLCTEVMNALAMQWLSPSTRPMDNVRFGVGEPQEDEVALSACGLSFMVSSIAFPRKDDYHRRFLSLRDLSPQELDSWKTEFMWFLRKLTFKYGRPLVLKSPAHTCRIKHLLELFPSAKFVHIHRHPYTVLQSSLHTLRKCIPYWTLQAHEPDVDQAIKDTKEVFDGYFEQRHLIPAENFCEVAFAALERDPIGEMRRIYECLHLPSFDELEPKLRAYLATLRGYTKNSYPELSPDIRIRLAREARQYFEQWQYST